MNVENQHSRINLDISKAFVNSLEMPTMIMQSDPRLVLTANTKASKLLGKDLHQIEGYRGGEVFDCIHSFTENGCGLDAGCEDCKIKNAVVETFSSGRSQVGVKTILDIKNDDAINPYVVKLSTEKVGDFALITLSEFYMINS